MLDFFVHGKDLVLENNHLSDAKDARDLLKESELLRQRILTLAAQPEWDLLLRHDLLADKPPSGLMNRSYRSVRRFLGKIGMLPPQLTAYPWLATLRHGKCPESNARLFLLWGLGMSKDATRSACGKILQRLDAKRDLSIVLVTDRADFAFYSRQKILVEYLPDLPGEGMDYQTRKQRYLAWRYRNALHVPLAAGELDDQQWESFFAAWALNG